VILRGSTQQWTLLHLKYRKHIKAGHGDGGGANRRHGADGKDEYLDVPIGTVVRDADSKEIVGEITEDGQEWVLIPGGRGGLGNDHFKSPTNQTPRYAQPGEDGQEVWRILELKLLADVGLVGFPNAGKSTLLSVVSAAKPEIADYPFTTIRPNLGMVDYRGDRSFVMADIPGIIEGAHEGKGLGLRFLRHIERNSVLLFLVPGDAADIAEAYRVLLRELEQYNPELLEKDRILSISKCDILDHELREEVTAELGGLDHHYFSAVTGEGLDRLKDLIWQAIAGDAS
jgi:GTP-binding protein